MQYNFPKKDGYFQYDWKNCKKTKVIRDTLYIEHFSLSEEEFDKWEKFKLSGEPYKKWVEEDIKERYSFNCSLFRSLGLDYEEELAKLNKIK